MQWFEHLSTKVKFFFGFGVMIAFLIIVAVYAKTGMTSIEQSQKDIFDVEFANTSDMLRLQAKEEEIRMSLLMMMSVAEHADKERWHQKIKESADEISRLLVRLDERNKSAPAIQRRIEEMNTARLAFRETRDSRIIPLIYDGKTDEAKKLALGIQSERFEKIRSITSELIKDAEHTARQEITASENMAREAVRLFTFLSAAAVVTGLAVAMYMNRIIAAPLKDMADIAGRIASGDLAVSAPENRRCDEVGVLAQTFHMMVERLKKQTRDISEAINVLASSTNEIAATTTQLAAGTEETAAAVAQTSTTVEEVKQTATVSSQKAKYVSDTAQSAVQVAQKGAKIVNDTAAGINNVQEQMEYIAETMIRLSEHSQAVGEIIAAVDDLSEQANLLAVNASIEASKAGEYGKGFLVVAQEIRSLAEQSKQSTKQVRTILGDIQKAGGAAVMATEKGSKAVDALVKQSTETGDSINELSRSISESSQAVIQIAASSQQQLIGMDQVAMAMGNIKQAALQNAASTKQVETTVKNLQEIGQSLKRQADYYRF